MIPIEWDYENLQPLLIKDWSIICLEHKILHLHISSILRVSGNLLNGVLLYFFLLQQSGE